MALPKAVTTRRRRDAREPPARRGRSRSAMKYLLILIVVVIFPVCLAAQTQTPPRLTTVTEQRYRLQPGDVLEVQFRYSPEFNQTVTVQPDGYIAMEIAGDLKVAGST